MPTAVRRVVALAEERLGSVAPGVVVAVGADDPALAARLPTGPRVVVPAPAGRRPAPWAVALMASAAATVLVDPCEGVAVAGVVRGPVVVAGVPAPPVAPGPGGLTSDPGSRRMSALWRAEGCAAAPGAPGVTWVAGPAVVAQAAEAWSRGDVVVTLPGAPRHDMLRRGGALAARSSLEVLEATRLLFGARPLAHELARRGRQQLDALDRIDDVIARFAEALLLAEAG